MGWCWRCCSGCVSCGAGRRRCARWSVARRGNAEFEYLVVRCEGFGQAPGIVTFAGADHHAVLVQLAFLPERITQVRDAKAVPVDERAQLVFRQCLTAAGTEVPT